MARQRQEYMRRYQREWMRKRRAQWFAGKTCAGCGSTDNLQCDYVDPATKLYQPAAIWSLSREKRERELGKCQPLCGDCHRKKTIAESRKPGHGEHMYRRGCRCDICREAAVARVMDYRIRTGKNSNYFRTKKKTSLANGVTVNTSRFGREDSRLEP